MLIMSQISANDCMFGSASGASLCALLFFAPFLLFPFFFFSRPLPLLVPRSGGGGDEGGRCARPFVDEARADWPPLTSRRQRLRIVEAAIVAVLVAGVRLLDVIFVQICALLGAFVAFSHRPESVDANFEAWKRESAMKSGSQSVAVVAAAAAIAVVWRVVEVASRTRVAE